MPKVSVVIPNFNHARFLEQRLRSVLDQTFGDFEVILLDDASTDDSLQVMAKFRSEPRVRVVENRVNSGSPFKQWNRGVREAKGEYVWIAESDDWAAPQLLERLVGRLDENPKVGLAYCQSWVVDEAGRTLQSGMNLLKTNDKERWTGDFVNEGRSECARYLLLENSIPNASAVVFRRRLYESMGGADESMRLCGDWMSWVGILLQSDVCFVSSPLNYYRIHPQALRQTTSMDVSAVEGWRVAEAILEQAQPAPADLAVLRRRFANEWASVTVRGHKKLLDSGLREFRELSKHDPHFALRSAGQLLRYGLAAARKRILRAIGLARQVERRSP